MERKATHKASEKSIVDIALDHGHKNANTQRTRSQVGFLMTGVD
jgi:hypothetical protein